MKNQIKSIISLTVICAVVALLLSVTNSITAPKIKEQEDAAANQSLTEVLPEGNSFETVKDLNGLPETVVEAYRETDGKGYVLKLVTSGYGAGLTIMCGVDSEGAVTGAKCIASNETLGYEKEYGNNFKAVTIKTVDGVDTVAKATMTTSAYKGAVRDAINAAAVLGGGTAEKTEEEILKENLSKALPEGEGDFTIAFLTEEISGFTAIYKADNDKGYVFRKEDKFIGVDASGNILGEEDADVANALPKLNDSSLEEIDITNYQNMPAQVKKAYKTQSGNYVIEARAAGYGINGDEYTRSNEYIYIRVSMTPQGKIISCETVSQKETQNVGDVCAKAEYFTSFNGKTETEAGNVDTVAGATVTTGAYRSTVLKVFEAVKILEGGSE